MIIEGLLLVPLALLDLNLDSYSDLAYQSLKLLELLRNEFNL